MAQSDHATLTEEREDAQPPPVVRHRLLPVLAVLAIAGSLVSLASLRLTDPAPAAVALDAKAASSPLLPANLTGIVPGLNGLVPANPVPVAANPAPAAAKPVAAAPAAGAPSASQTTAITIMGFAYSPAAVTIAAGDTVVWTNHDSAPHNVVVTSGPERFTSPTLQTGQSYSYTFTQAGAYAYFCSIHPNMRAAVTVQGGSTPPPPGNPPPPPSQPDNCVSERALDAFMAHVRSAHLERSLLQQVTDILAIDQYVLTHTVWLETVIQPVFDGTADQVVKDTLAPVMAHINAMHLERSPFQQLDDILATDQYVLTHTAWLETVLAPLAGQLTC